MKNINIFVQLVAFLFLNSTIINTVFAADITELIKQETQLDEQIKEACSKHCKGNRKRGTLKRFSLERTGSDTFFARAEAELQNRQDVAGVTVYKYSVIVVAEGLLNNQNCLLTVENIEIENDRLGLSSLVRGQEGKTHHIEGCEKFTSGL